MAEYKDGFFQYNSQNNRFMIVGRDMFELSCGYCFQIEINNEYVDTRIEINPTTDEWYLVGIGQNIYDLIGYRVKYIY